MVQRTLSLQGEGVGTTREKQESVKGGRPGRIAGTYVCYRRHLTLTIDIILTSWYRSLMQGMQLASRDPHDRGFRTTAHGDI